MRKYASSPDLRNLSLCIVLLLANSILAVAQHGLVLHAFENSPNDGRTPQGALIADASGHLYGTTASGGANYGIVYELSPPTSNGPWTETILYSFTGNADGGFPRGSLVFDAAGDLYGATSGGANPNCQLGCGTVFELSPPVVQGGNWTETTIYSFSGGSDGGSPYAGLIFDTTGGLYGTTLVGGDVAACTDVSPGCGAVFELSPPIVQGGAWTEAVLYGFVGGSDGVAPAAPVVMDGAGRLYGTTNAGGNGSCQCGIVFELTPSAGGVWTETVLHAFNAFTGDGGSPFNSGLIIEKSGSLAGTCQGGGAFMGGTVFGLQPPLNQGGKWKYAVLYSFGGTQVDGVNPVGGVVSVGSNVLYGITLSGGTDLGGAVFQLTRMGGGIWKETGLFSANNTSLGSSPQAGLLFHNGTLIGTAGQGGPANAGVVFRINR